MLIINFIEVSNIDKILEIYSFTVFYFHIDLLHSLLLFVYISGISMVLHLLNTVYWHVRVLCKKRVMQNFLCLKFDNDNDKAEQFTRGVRKLPRTDVTFCHIWSLLTPNT